MRSDQVYDLLDRWEESRQQGNELSLEQVCAECPELRKPLERALRQMKEVGLFVDRMNGEGATPPLSTALGDGDGRQAGTEGRFQFLRPHRRGGLGEVFIAYDGEFRREVALKRIQAAHAVDADSCRRFQLEAEITGQLEHPGIVPVYALMPMGEGPPGYAMRLIKGETLKEAIEQFHKHENPKDENPKDKPSGLAFRQLLNRFVTVCQTIAYAHSRGIIHRDLKPENVVLGKYGETIVLDWGLAKRVMSGQSSVGGGQSSGNGSEETLQGHATDYGLRTKTGQVVGTPRFMSPEQAAGVSDLVGPASDIYSLGATLYCLLTGSVPFPDPRESSVPAVLERVQQGKFRRPRQVQRRVAPALEAICLKAMAPQREDRYPSAGALAEDLEHWLADEAVAAYREPWLARWRRWGRRHRPVVTGLVVTLVVGLLGLMGALGMMTAFNRQLDAANADLVQKRDELDVRNADLLRANASEKQARERAENLLEYFVGTLGRADPSQDGEKVTVVQVLKWSAKELPTKASLEPGMRAPLLHTIGRTYMGLGLAREAVDVLESALALCKEHVGPAHRDTLASMDALALAYESAGRLADALPLIEKTVELAKVKLGSEHPDTLTAMRDLGRVLLAAGRTRDALPLLEETVALQKAKLGPDITAMTTLASAYQAAGRLSDALSLFDETLKVCKAKLGADHSTTLVLSNNLALAYQLAGRLADAVPLYEETLALQKEKLGPEHPTTLTSMNNLAGAYEDAGRLADALALYEGMLKPLKAKLGPDHPKLLALKNNLALAYRSAGRFADSRLLFEETLKLANANLGPEHPLTLTSMNNLALAYQDVDRLVDAVPLFEEALKLQKAKLGLQHPNTLAAMHNLAGAYREADRFADALPLYKETLELRKTRLGPEHPSTLSTICNLANLLKDEGKLAEAEALFREVLSRRNVLPVNHAVIAKTLAALGELFIQRGQAHEAERFLRECLEMRRKSLPKGHRLTAEDEGMLGDCLTRLGRLAEAEPLLLNSYDALKSAQGVGPASLRKAADRVIRLYETWNKPKHAAEWQAERDQLIKTRGMPEQK